jgi:hypothetical protein
MELLLRFGQVFYTVVLPILVLVAVGWLLQARLGLDMLTLRRLNFNFVLPAMVYYSIVGSSLDLKAVCVVVGFALLCFVLMVAVALLAARVCGVRADFHRALVMTSAYYNSGNYGLPLQDLAFAAAGLGALAMAYQTFVMVVQNFLTFTLGIVIASGHERDRHAREHLAQVLRFPPVYALLLAVLTVWIRHLLGDGAADVQPWVAPFWEALRRMKDAFIAVALLTLGAQLAITEHKVADGPLALSVVLRLVVAPVLALLAIVALGLEGFTAQVLLISSATPTAINSMLLCLEFGNHPQFAARAVFFSTLLSPVTVTLVIVLAQGPLLPGFGR